MKKFLLPYLLKKKTTIKKTTLLGYWLYVFNCPFKKKNIVIHPWDNFKKLQVDSKLINNYYKIYLEKLLNILNREHNRSNSKKFWEILIGPWLFSFITIFYEKWLLLDKIKNNNYIIENYNHLVDHLIVKSHLEFKRKTLDDEWHYNLFLRILKKKNPKKIFLKKIKYKKKILQIRIKINLL